MSDLRVAIAGAGGRMGAQYRAVASTPGLIVHLPSTGPGRPPSAATPGSLGIEKLGVVSATMRRLRSRAPRRSSILPRPRQRDAGRLAAARASSTSSAPRVLQGRGLGDRQGRLGRRRIVKTGNFSLGVATCWQVSVRQVGGACRAMTSRSSRCIPPEVEAPSGTR